MMKAPSAAVESIDGEEDLALASAQSDGGERESRLEVFFRDEASAEAFELELSPTHDDCFPRPSDGGVHHGISPGDAVTRVHPHEEDLCQGDREVRVEAGDG